MFYQVIGVPTTLGRLRGGERPAFDRDLIKIGSSTIDR